MNKIENGLSLIKVDEHGNWFVPNRKNLNMTISEFIEFERKRILEFENEQIKNTKYKYHFMGEKEYMDLLKDKKETKTFKDIVNESMSSLELGKYECKIIKAEQDFENEKVYLTVKILLGQFENKEYKISYKIDEKNYLYTTRKLIYIIKNWMKKMDDDQKEKIKAAVEQCGDINNLLLILEKLGSHYSVTMNYYEKEFNDKVMRIKEIK